MTSRFPSPRVVRRVRLGTSAADESTLVDVHLADGRITGIHPASAIDERADEGAAERATGGVIDGRGLLALPGLVNAHAHVDKSWWGLPWQSYGGEGGTEGRIRHERARRDELGIAWQYARASGIVRDHDLRRVVAVATGAAAPFAGLPEGRLGVGDRADLVLVDAENAMDALVRTPPREVVIAGGRLLVG